ncbi:MAG: hypothetical protein JW908_05025 [Anaerolineales bacterium]|nr:hypothetical protein [Anaerolineales bacterium]
MDAVRELLKKPVVLGVAGLIMGLFIGWFVIGWGLWPVKWVDAEPSQLRADLKEDYLRMAIDSYTARQDAALAKSRFELLGEEADELLQGIMADPRTQNPVLITAFTDAIKGEAVTLPETSMVQPTAETGAEAEIEPEAETETSKTSVGFSITKIMVPLMCVVLAGVVIALAVFFFIRSRRGGVGASPVEESPQPQPEVSEESWTSVPKSADTPMVQFMASYKLGDDLFDDSFSIDSPAGEFLGECGVGISEPIGVGEPKKVTAFEAWLFDKNDIQTVTKVLMSAHAFSDEATKQRLAAKGEPILAQPGVETILETQTLRLTARVVDMGYGDGSMPAESYFDRFILELAVWSKI